MKKRSKIIIIITLIMGIILSSCSHAYEPYYMQKKKKSKCGDCSRWN